MLDESLGKFPFKHMQAMIDAIASAGSAGAGISTIAHAGQSCHPDTAETLAMAVHLCNQGLVFKDNDGTWDLRPPGFPVRKAPGGFRRRYLEPVDSILGVLRARGAASAGSIARETGMNTTDVEAFLLFLVHLTARGRIEKEPGTTIYKIVPW